MAVSQKAHYLIYISPPSHNILTDTNKVSPVKYYYCQVVRWIQHGVAITRYPPACRDLVHSNPYIINWKSKLRRQFLIIWSFTMWVDNRVKKTNSIFLNLLATLSWMVNMRLRKCISLTFVTQEEFSNNVFTTNQLAFVLQDRH